MAASASVTTKMSPVEFGFIIKALTMYRDHYNTVAKNTKAELKDRQEARGIAVEADNLIRNLKA
jgi:hypothetical protein